MAKIYQNPLQSFASQDIIEFEAKEECFFCRGINSENCCCSESNPELAPPLNFWTNLCLLRDKIIEQVNLLGNSGIEYFQLFDIGIKKLVDILDQQIQAINQERQEKASKNQECFDCRGLGFKTSYSIVSGGELSILSVLLV